jgi:3-oxoadipate enol-lactonase
MPIIGKFHYLEALPPAGVRPRGTLLLLHAFPLTAEMFEPQLTLAAGGWRVIAPHLRGMDGAPQGSPAASVDDYAGDIIDLFDALHIEDAVVGGVSMGGYAAFALFRLAPRYIRAIVLADTRPQADTPEGVEGRKHLMGILRDKGPAGVADTMLPKLLGDFTRRENPGLVARARDLILSNSSEAIASAITVLMTRPDSTKLLPTIHCPTLIVVGEHDVVTPPPLSREMQQGIAGSELATIPNAGHLSSLEQPQAFNAALAHFLEHRV